MALSYGSTPGVSIDVEGGVIAGVELGEEELLVLFAQGDPENGNAQVNSPTRVTSTEEAETEFGEGTRLAEELKDAIYNGANARAGYVYGVMPATQSVTGEAIAGGSGTIGNAPIIEDTAELTVQNTTDGQEADVEFRYDSPPTAPTAENTVYINPFSGETEAGDGDDYEIDYKYLDWESAIQSASTIPSEGESAVFAAASVAESVASTLYGEAVALRDPDYKMVKAIAGAEPNANTSETPPDPMVDTESYDDTLDSFPGFAVAPARQDDSTTTLIGAFAGVAAGNALDDPILTSSLSDVTIERGENDEALLTKAERDALRDAQVIPIAANGSIEIDGELSTDTEEAWKTTFQAVRTIDRAVLGVREIATSFRGELDIDSPEYDTEEIAAQEALGFLEDMVDDRLLQPNTDEEPSRLFVRPADGGSGTISLEVGVTPTYAVDTFETTITVDTA